MNRYSGRVAWVTGAGSGIGEAIAQELLSRGATVIATDVAADRLLALEAAGAHTFHQDVADRDQWVELNQAVCEQFGGVDVLVNNAGVSLAGPFLESSAADLDWQLDINTRGVMYGCHVVMPCMLKRPDPIVINLSSLFGIISAQHNAAYCMSKHSVRVLGEVLRLELGDGIQITSVHPGAVATRIVTDGRFVPGGPVDRRAAAKIIASGVSPEGAAQTILDGAARGRERILVGSDAKVLAGLQRMFTEAMPSLQRRYAAWILRRKNR